MLPARASILDLEAERNSLQKGENVDEDIVLEILTDPGTRLVTIYESNTETAEDAVSYGFAAETRDDLQERGYSDVADHFSSITVMTVRPAESRAPGIFVLNEHEYTIAYSNVETHTIYLPHPGVLVSFLPIHREHIGALLAHEATELYARSLGMTPGESHDIAQVVEAELCGESTCGGTMLDQSIRSAVALYLKDLEGKTTLSPEDCSYREWLQGQLRGIGDGAYDVIAADSLVKLCADTRGIGFVTRRSQFSLGTDLCVENGVVDWSEATSIIMRRKFDAQSLRRRLKEDVAQFEEIGLTKDQIKMTMKRMISASTFERLTSRYDLSTQCVCEVLSRWPNYPSVLTKLHYQKSTKGRKVLY